jgi:S-adenosylmethionine:tRNA ribosyltransferase-isomerase
LEPRDSSRLLVYDRKTDEIIIAIFYDIGNFLEAGDLLIRNPTRVFARQIYAKKT